MRASASPTRGARGWRPVTRVQTIAYDRPRRWGVLDIVVVVIAVMAPTVAAILLWNARGHREVR
jgi:hypothetical protein